MNYSLPIIKKIFIVSGTAGFIFGTSQCLNESVKQYTESQIYKDILNPNFKSTYERIETVIKTTAQAVIFGATFPISIPYYYYKYNK